MTGGCRPSMGRPMVLIALLMTLALLAAACTSGPPEAATAPGPPPDRGPGLTTEEQAELDAAVDAFLDSPGVPTAEPVVELIGRSGELRYAPWLLDVVQMGMSNVLGQRIVEVLGDLTGQEPSGQTFVDFARFGSLIETWDVDPGRGYRAWKTTLFSRFDAGFGPLLDSVDDADGFARIRFGGVVRGGIPELNDPARIPASEATWLLDDEIVLGVDVDGELGGRADGEAVAYPFRIIGHHELVNDEVAGIPVALVYCTLCRTGLLFDRRVGERVLDFETSGLLLNSNKLMVDRQTDTLWQHTAGTAIGGELDGAELDRLLLETTTWAEWLAEHPDTEVLDIPAPIFFEDPERPPIAYPYEAGAPYASYYRSDETLFPIRIPPDTFAGKDEVIGIEWSGGTLAVGVDAVAGGPARIFPVGSSVVVVVPTDRGARVYDASGWPAAVAAVTAGAAGESIDLAGSDGIGAVTTDGIDLPRIPVEQGFWFAWWDRFPDTAAWPLP